MTGNRTASILASVFLTATCADSLPDGLAIVSSLDCGGRYTVTLCGVTHPETLVCEHGSSINAVALPDCGELPVLRRVDAD